MDINRIKRIESLMQNELAKIIHLELTDPKLQWITITGVKVSRDLSIAKVYVVSRNETDAEQTIKLLNQKAKPLRYQLAKEITTLRKMPELRFYYDHSISEGNKIEQLLKEIDIPSEKEGE